MLIKIGALVFRLVGAVAAFWAALSACFLVWPFFLPRGQRPPLHELGSITGLLLFGVFVAGALALGAFRLADILERRAAPLSGGIPAALPAGSPSRPIGPRRWKPALAAAGIVVTLWLCISFWKSTARILRRVSEGNTKGMLGGIRGALSVCYGDREGRYPDDLSVLLGGTDAKGARKQWLGAIPPAHPAPYHPISNAVRYGKVPDDAGGWLYNNVAGDARIGEIMVNCTHTDSRGRDWTSY